MGLDMYAHTIRADLVDALPQTDVSLTKAVCVHLGLADLTPEQIGAMTDEQRHAYEDRIRELVDQAIRDGLLDLEFGYWRKFNHLHGWMEKLYFAKGGTAEQFNCTNVRLMPNDLDVLESLASLHAMPATPGFFFGSLDPFNDEDKDTVLEFVAKARQAIAEGKAVWYDSWW